MAFTGDGGNEIGTACIADAVRKVVPTGAQCGCPCDSGIAAATHADFCVFGSKSNYGGFAIEDCLAAGLEGPRSCTVKSSGGAFMKQAQPWAWSTRSRVWHSAGTTSRWIRTSTNWW